MTPAINLLKKAKLDYQVHTYDHDPGSTAYGEEAAQKLGISFDRLFKTLVVRVNNKDMMVALVPVSRQLDVKLFARAVKAKKAGMADKKDVERTTGYLLGAVSPLGQKKKLPTVIDTSALDFETIFVSAGRRGLQVALSPEDICSQTQAQFFDIAG